MRAMDQMTNKSRHRLPLLGALFLVLFTLVLVIGSVLFDGPVVQTSNADPLLERALLFRDAKDGQVVVLDAKSNQKLANFGKGEGAFIRISVRSMNRNRMSNNIALHLPYQLIKQRDGNLFIKDPASGHQIRINAFGAVAINTFTPFLSTTHSDKGAKG